MVMYVPIDRLRPGMTLLRDAYGFDEASSRILLLKEGQVLQQVEIDQLKGMGLSGAYICYTDQHPAGNRDSLYKEKQYSNTKLLYTLSQRAPGALTINMIGKADSMLRRMIGMIDSGEIPVDISALWLYDDDTYNHSIGVTLLSTAIGITMELDGEDLQELALCALLHDIGKITIPVQIITKPSRLSNEEFNIVKIHAQKGGDILLEKGMISQQVYRGIISHHERFDGLGYPQKLSGKEIPEFGRIISCADVYEALTASRPYRVPATPTEAIEYLMGGIGSQFDYDIVEVFLKCVSPYPVGSCVVLSNGEKAIVIGQNIDYPLRPVIRMLEKPYTVMDLCNDPIGFSIVISSLYEELL